MKNLLIALSIIAMSSCVYAAEPVYAKTTPNPVVVPSTEKQKVCIKDDKTGKETCKMMKVHKKLEGTAVPTKK